MQHLIRTLFFGLFLFLGFQIQAQHEQHEPSKKVVAKKAVTKSAVVKSEDGKTATFAVYGNCGMCKKRIEGAVSDVKGLHSANWDMETGEMTVSYDPELVSTDDLMKKIAAVGHDTEKFRAEDKVYKKLHGCCQYDRPTQ